MASAESHILNFDPSTIAGAIIWGVVAGVVTSAALLILGQLFQKILIPWYQELVFKGVDLRGKWIAQKTYANANAGQHAGQGSGLPFCPGSQGGKLYTIASRRVTSAARTILLTRE